MTTQKKDIKTTIRFNSEESRERFNELKNGHGSIGEFIDELLSTYESVKNNQSSVNLPANAIELSDVPNEYFSGSRQREKDLQNSVKELTGLESLVMTEKQFLKLVSDYSGQTINEIVSKGIQSYGQSTLGKIATGSSRGLGSKDDEITTMVKSLCEMILSGNLPQFDKVTVTKISQFTSKNYDTVMGWAKRKGVYEMIKDSNNCVTVENMEVFLNQL